MHSSERQQLFSLASHDSFGILLHDFAKVQSSSTFGSLQSVYPASSRSSQCFFASSHVKMPSDIEAPEASEGEDKEGGNE